MITVFGALGLGIKESLGAEEGGPSQRVYQSRSSDTSTSVDIELTCICRGRRRRAHSVVASHPRAGPPVGQGPRGAGPTGRNSGQRGAAASQADRRVVPLRQRRRGASAACPMHAVGRSGTEQVMEAIAILAASDPAALSVSCLRQALVCCALRNCVCVSVCAGFASFLAFG